MKSYLKDKLFIILFLGLTGCATTSGYKRMIDSWIGYDKEELIMKWGYPNRVIERENGGEAYVYESQTAVQTPVYQAPSLTHTRFDYYSQTSKSITYPGVSYGGGLVNYWCITVFEIDEEGIITGWKAEGNNCVAYYQ